MSFLKISPAVRLILLVAVTSGALLYGTLVRSQAVTASNGSIPAPTDTPYLGTMALQVNLTDLERKIMQVRQTLPVRPGALTLLYPRWLPGTHSPSGTVNRMAGLQILAAGKPLEWRRDTQDSFAFHVTVPAGVSELALEFQHLSPVSSNTGRVVMTPEIIGLQWATVVLYPAGHYASAITVKATAVLPPGWQSATALDLAKRTDSTNTLEFAPTSLETLVDSPLWAGKHTRRIELDRTAGKPPVALTLFADDVASLAATPEQIAAHMALVTQSDRVFGSRHFKRYEFLLALSEHFSGIGLEHAESSENGVKPNYFTEWAKSTPARTLLPHEYAHSWNGKFRRPSDLWTPNYNVPMQGSLLWMYEGQTQFWGYVLAARSGIVPLADSLDDLAQTAAWLDARAGRGWRNLQDTTNEPLVGGRGSLDWRSWQRSADYYDEALLIWLDVDSKLRELSGGKKSLDDVAKGFFGVQDGRVAVLTYTFADIASALNATAAYDWTGFLRQRLDGKGAGAPLDGLARSGWRLVFTDKQSEFAKNVETERRRTDFSYSLGFDVTREGKLASLQWGGPAFKAGLTPDMQLIAVNGFSYKAELLRDAITAAKTSGALELLVKFENRYKTVKLSYTGGLRYPKLERIAGTPDGLTALLSAVK